MITTLRVYVPSQANEECSDVDSDMTVKNPDEEGTETTENLCEEIPCDTSVGEDLGERCGRY